MLHIFGTNAVRFRLRISRAFGASRKGTLRYAKEEKLMIISAFGIRFGVSSALGEPGYLKKSIE